MAEANSELMKSPFDRLPLEIIHQIVGLLPLARDVTNLSQSCAWLNKAVENGGWDFFTNNRFPSLGVLALTAKGTPRARSFGKDAAKSLTAISRSWDRRAFIQRELGRPLAFSESERRGKMLQGHCIDSYLEFTGGDWASQREVLVMGVGSGWTMRVRLPGSSVSDQGLSRRIHWYSSRRVKGSSQEHSNSNILSINLLRPSQRICTAPDREELICPTQDGGSRHLVLSLETAEVEEELLNVRNQQDIYQYRRNDESVLSGSKFAWSTALSKDSAPLLSEVSAEKGIAIFKVPDERLPKPDPGPPRVITPSVVIGKSEDFVLDRSTYATQTWTVSWLQNGLLATGSGPGPEPLHVFDIYGPMPTIPLRAFPCPQDDSDPSTPAGNSARTSSVFAIAVLPPEFTGAGCNGNVFLSGWWDGSIRLQDLRDPRASICQFTDSVASHSAVYSLAVFGRERFVAGTSSHSLVQVFDLRMAGNRPYSHLGEPSGATTSNAPDDWSLYCRPNSSEHYRATQGLSAVSCLSVPSPTSPTLYLGLQNAVHEYTAMSVVQEMKSPSPPSCGMMSWSPATDLRREQDSEHQLRISNRRGNHRHRRIPIVSGRNPILNLASYGHESFLSLKLKKQLSVYDALKSQAPILLDERWIDI